MGRVSSDSQPSLFGLFRSVGSSVGWLLAVGSCRVVLDGFFGCLECVWMDASASPAVSAFRIRVRVLGFADSPFKCQGLCF